MSRLKNDEQKRVEADEGPVKIMYNDRRMKNVDIEIIEILRS